MIIQNIFRSLLILPYPLAVVMVYVAYLTGQLMNYHNITLFSLFFGFVISFSFIGGFNSFNAVFDSKVDKESKPNRPIPSGLISKQFALVYSLVLYFIFLFLTYLFYETNIIIISLIMVVLSVLYSAFLRLKRIPVVSDIIITLSYTLFPIFLGFALKNSNYLNLPIVPTLLIFIFGFAVLVTKNFEDYLADKKQGIITLPGIFGIKKTIILVILILLLSNFFLLFFIASKKLPLFLIIIVLLSVYLFLTSFRNLLKNYSQANSFLLFRDLALFMVTLELLIGFSIFF